MKLLPEFPGVDGSWQEPTGVDKEGSGQEMAGKGLDRRYPETVLEPNGSNMGPCWVFWFRTHNELNTYLVGK